MLRLRLLFRPLSLFQTPLWPYFLGLNLGGAAVICAVLAITQFGQNNFYQQNCYKISLLTSLVLCSLSLFGVASLMHRSQHLHSQFLSAFCIKKRKSLICLDEVKTMTPHQVGYCCFLFLLTTPSLWAWTLKGFF